MLRSVERCCLLSWMLVLLSATVSAQGLERRGRSPGPVSENQMISPLSGNSVTMKGASAPLDYATFVYELVAFMTKEILSDSRDEYPGSPIGSRLSRSMPAERSEFGSHCLAVVAQLGSAVPSLSASGVEFARPALPLDYLARAAAAALALRRMWSASENDPGSNRRGISLNPKVGTNKVRISLTFHW